MSFARRLYTPQSTGQNLTQALGVGGATERAMQMGAIGAQAISAVGAGAAASHARRQSQKASTFASIGSILGAGAGGIIGFFAGGPAGAAAGATAGAKIGGEAGKGVSGVEARYGGEPDVIGSALALGNAYLGIKNASMKERELASKLESESMQRFASEAKVADSWVEMGYSRESALDAVKNKDMSLLEVNPELSATVGSDDLKEIKKIRMNLVDKRLRGFDGLDSKYLEIKKAKKLLDIADRENDPNIVASELGKFSFIKSVDPRPSNVDLERLGGEQSYKAKLQRFYSVQSGNTSMIPGDIKDFKEIADIIERSILQDIGSEINLAKNSVRVFHPKTSQNFVDRVFMPVSEKYVPTEYTFSPSGQTEGVPTRNARGFAPTTQRLLLDDFVRVRRAVRL